MVKINKKAMEMSLNLIIMLIIGMVILGLVIGFVNSMVGKGTEQFEGRLNEEQNYKLEEVRNCAENFCVAPVSVTIKKGEKGVVFVKMRNTGTSTTAYSQGAGGLASGTTLKASATSKDGGTSISPITVISPAFSIAAGSDTALMVTLSVSNTAEIGTYFVTFEYDSNGASNFEKKSITVTVK